MCFTIFNFLYQYKIDDQIKKDCIFAEIFNYNDTEGVYDKIRIGYIVDNTEVNGTNSFVGVKEYSSDVNINSDAHIHSIKNYTAFYIINNGIFKDPEGNKITLQQGDVIVFIKEVRDSRTTTVEKLTSTTKINIKAIKIHICFFLPCSLYFFNAFFRMNFLIANII